LGFGLIGANVATKGISVLQAIDQPELMNDRN